MSHENMPRIQTRIQTPTIKTDIIPALLKTTENRTLGYGLRCSIKNCTNRHAKSINFFGFPNDIQQKKKWIKKCGLSVDPTDKVLRLYRVCGAHFEDDCFTNTKLKNRLKLGAVPSLFLDNDNAINVRNIPSTSSPVNSGLNCKNKRSIIKKQVVQENEPSCSSTDYYAKVDAQETPLYVYINSTIRSKEDFVSHCVVPGCITNTDVEEVENIFYFSPQIESVDKWSLELGLQLNVNNMVCERHFRQEDMLYPELLINGSNIIVKSLVPSALPIPINATQSASIALTRDIVKCLDNTDKCSTSISKSIDDFSTIESDYIQKLKNLSTNGSLSITPIENPKVIKPSVHSFSKVDAKSSVTMNLEPKHKHKLPSTKNSSSPSGSQTHSLPSASSSSMNNISQQSMLQFEQEATLTSKMPDKLSSNSVYSQEFIDNDVIILKHIVSTNKTNSSELPEIKMPIISKCYSLAKKSDDYT